MTRNEIAVKFADLADRAESLNRSNRDKRFWPMQHVRRGRLQQFGMYDSTTKRYILSDVNGRDVNERLTEIRQMLQG